MRDLAQRLVAVLLDVLDAVEGREILARQDVVWLRNNAPNAEVAAAVQRAFPNADLPLGHTESNRHLREAVRLLGGEPGPLPVELRSPEHSTAHSGLER